MTLFYRADITKAELRRAVLGIDEAAPVDTVDFPDEAGGDQERQLALPFLPGMDAVVVDDASLSFRVGDKALEIHGYTVSAGPDGGIVVRLPAPSRLRKLDLTYVSPAPPAGQAVHLIVRTAVGGGFGPAVLAAPDFPPPGLTYGRLLGGMTMQDAPDNRHVVTLPDLAGAAFLVQVAAGTSPVDLAPMAVTPTVNRVVIAAAPRNLSIVLKGPDVPLWGNKDILLPSSGQQGMTFLPLAQRQLSGALKSAAADSLTLPLRLGFHSDTGALLEVTERSLSGHYSVRPLPVSPVTLRMGGRAVPLVLNAPAGLSPRDAAATLTARPLGRALNAGSPPAPLDLPGQGLRLTTGRIAAARIPVAPRNGPAQPVQIAAIALRLTTPEAAELALELRADTGGRPGGILAPAAVRQLAAGFDDWLDLPLAAALPVAANASLWVSVRLTKGTLLWHAASGPGTAVVSIDKGATWGEPAAVLQANGRLLAQAFHALDPPMPRPILALRSADTALDADWLAGAIAAGGPGEFHRPSAPLAAPALKRLAAATGTARVDTRFLLYSDAVFDLVVSDMTITYDPSTARAP